MSTLYPNTSETDSLTGRRFTCSSGGVDKAEVRSEHMLEALVQETDNLEGVKFLFGIVDPPVTSVNGRDGDVVIAPADVGLQRSVVSVDVTNTDTALATITGLSATVLAAGAYIGRLVVYCANTVAGEGAKFSLGGGTATWTSFRVSLAANIQGATTNKTIGSTVAQVISMPSMADTSTHCFVIEWAGVVNAGGTLVAQFGKDTTGGGGTITVHANSHLQVEACP